MPKALYRQLQQPGREPIWVSEGAAIETSAQISDYLLCSECEDLFSRHGERWVLAHCYRNDTKSFSLQTFLKSATPYFVSCQTKLFDSMSILAVKADKLVYFAVSIFWRAAIHCWGKGTKQLNLGKYAETLRHFLLGRQDLPPEVVVLVIVAKTENPTVIASFPNGDREDGFHKYRFNIPGIGFWLFLGKRIPEDARVLCAHHNKTIIMTDLIELGKFRGFTESRSTAKVKGRLAKKVM